MFSRNHITVLVKKDPEDKSFREPLDPPNGASYPFCCTFKQDFTRLPYIKLLRRVKIFPKHLTTQSFFFFFFPHRASMGLVFHGKHLDKYFFLLAISTFISS